MRHFGWVVMLCGVSCASSSWGGVIFTKIADTHTPIPSGSDNFSDLDVPVTKGGTVGFVGSGGTRQEGVYIWKGGVLSRVADRKTPIPEATGTFVGFNSVVVDGSNVAFEATQFPTSHLSGIYKSVGQGVVRVLDNPSAFASYSPPVLSGKDVYFNYEAPGPFNVSLLTDAGGTLHTLVKTGDRIPGSIWTFNLISNSRAADGAVAFYGNGVYERSIYVYRNGTVTQIAGNNTVVPGLTYPLTGVSNVQIGFDGKDVAFAGVDYTELPRLFRTRDGAIEQIATADTVIDGFGKLNFAGIDNIRLAIDGDRVVFSNGRGIFVDENHSIRALVGLGDQLFGRTISELNFRTDGYGGGDDVAFYAKFTDGTTGVYLVTMVPLPSGLHAGWLVGAWVVYRAQVKRRCRGG